MSYYRLTYHLVFATKRREPTLAKHHQPALYAYIAGIVRAKHGHVYAIGGLSEHIHILLDIPPRHAIVDFVRELKHGSSHWMKLNARDTKWDGWERGFGIFACSYAIVDRVKHYIETQEKHHLGKDSRQEFREFLDSQGIPYDERYLFHDAPPAESCVR